MQAPHRVSWALAVGAAVSVVAALSAWLLGLETGQLRFVAIALSSATLVVGLAFFSAREAAELSRAIALAVAVLLGAMVLEAIIDADVSDMAGVIQVLLARVLFAVVGGVVVGAAGYMSWRTDVVGLLASGIVVGFGVADFAQQIASVADADSSLIAGAALFPILLAVGVAYTAYARRKSE